jgi:hypothetical protein
VSPRFLLKTLWLFDFIHSGLFDINARWWTPCFCANYHRFMSRAIGIPSAQYSLHKFASGPSIVWLQPWRIGKVEPEDCGKHI